MGYLNCHVSPFGQLAEDGENALDAAIVSADRG